MLGIPTERYLLGAFALCGALAGLAGAVQATGFHHKLVPAVSGGYGFLGILVVLLAGFRTVWIGPLALVFVAVAAGGTQLQLRLDVDSSLSGVVLGVGVLVALLLGAGAPRKRRRWSRNPDMEAAFASIVAAATPLVFAAVGETITERSGVVNLGLEGSLMLSAMTGFAVAVTTGSTLLGFVAAALVSMAAGRCGGLRWGAPRCQPDRSRFRPHNSRHRPQRLPGHPFRWCGGARRALTQHPGAVRDPSARPGALLAEHRGLRQLSIDRRGSALPVQHAERSGAARRG